MQNVILYKWGNQVIVIVFRQLLSSIYFPLQGKCCSRLGDENKEPILICAHGDGWHLGSAAMEGKKGMHQPNPLSKIIQIMYILYIDEFIYFIFIHVFTWFIYTILVLLTEISQNSS